MQITNTTDYPQVASIMMLVYGMGGVGKTTFAASFPKPLLLDFENGAKYFGERGIKVDVALFKNWLSAQDKVELKGVIDSYETIIVDPIGEAMEKLMNDQETVKGSKYRQANGDLTMAGWGQVKKEMRNFIKWLRDSGKNVVLVAHVDEKGDEDRIVKRPMLATKLSDELITMVDIVGYMRVITQDGEEKRVISVDAGDDKIISKDRTGKLGKYIKPEYAYIAQVLGIETKKEEKPKAPKAPAKPKKEKVEEPAEEVTDEEENE